MEYIVKSINNFDLNDIKQFYNKIPKIKKEKIDKYKINDAKSRSIVGEILLEELLSKKGISYNSIDYFINDEGKPYIKNNNLFFNISHSENYVITVISEKEIGVDIEKIRKVPLNTIRQFATENEKKYILSSNSNIEERLFKIYTLKEAYFKMKGENLSRIFEVEFKIDNNIIYCSDNNIIANFINDIDGYIISYCEKKEI